MKLAYAVSLYHSSIVQEGTDLVVERREERPVLMNAFDLISTAQGLNLGTLFEKQMVIRYSKSSFFFCSSAISRVRRQHCILP